MAEPKGQRISDLEINPFFRVRKDRVGWLHSRGRRRCVRSISIEVIRSSADTKKSEREDIIWSFLGGDRRIEALGINRGIGQGEP